MQQYKSVFKESEDNRWQSFIKLVHGVQYKTGPVAMLKHLDFNVAMLGKVINFSFPTEGVISMQTSNLGGAGYSEASFNINKQFFVDYTDHGSSSVWNLEVHLKGGFTLDIK